MVEFLRGNFAGRSATRATVRIISESANECLLLWRPYCCHRSFIIVPVSPIADTFAEYKIATSRGQLTILGTIDALKNWNVRGRESFNLLFRTVDVIADYMGGVSLPLPRPLKYKITLCTRVQLVRCSRDNEENARIYDAFVNEN